MNEFNIIPITTLFNMIYNYGPKLRYEMSRNSFPVYKLEKNGEIDVEKYRMNLFSKHFSEATPDKKVLKKIIKYIDSDKVLEINSYLGLWSYLLLAYGIDIKTTSKHNPSLISFTEIEHLNPIKAVEKYKDRNILFNIWSKNSDNTNVYEAINNFKGNKLIIISERKITDHIINKITPGTSRILKDLKNVKEKYEWVLVQEYEIPQWLNFNDKVYILEKLQL